jgi:hypothetical protein
MTLLLVLCSALPHMYISNQARKLPGSFTAVVLARTIVSSAWKELSPVFASLLALADIVFGLVDSVFGLVDSVFGFLQIQQ